MRLPVRALVMLVLALTPAGPQAQATRASLRVYAGTSIVTFDAMIADLAKADVLFVGEERAAASSQRAELVILEGLARLQPKVVLALDSLERDAQEPLEHLLMQHTTEAEFLDEARPREEYERDHKPLVALAIRHMWPVVAANVPRRIVAAVRTSGLEALSTLPASDKAFFAQEVKCVTENLQPQGRGLVEMRQPAARAFQRVARRIRSSGSRSPELTLGPTFDREFHALCLEDETIAESVAQSHAAGSIGGNRALVVAVLDGIHSDFRDGAAASLVRRLPKARVAVIAIVPAANAARTSDPVGRADYVIHSE